MAGKKLEISATAARFLADTDRAFDPINEWLLELRSGLARAIPESQRTWGFPPIARVPVLPANKEFRVEADPSAGTNLLR